MAVRVLPLAPTSLGINKPRGQFRDGGSSSSQRPRPARCGTWPRPKRLREGTLPSAESARRVTGRRTSPEVRWNAQPSIFRAEASAVGMRPSLCLAPLTRAPLVSPLTSGVLPEPVSIAFRCREVRTFARPQGGRANVRGDVLAVWIVGRARLCWPATFDRWRRHGPPPCRCPPLTAVVPSGVCCLALSAAHRRAHWRR
jgi:hypothetical protein